MADNESNDQAADDKSAEQQAKRHSDDHVDFYSRSPYNKMQKRQRTSTVPAESSEQPRDAAAAREKSRTVYLGALPQDITYREIFDVIKTGPVEAVRLLPEKDCAFVDFCREEDAEGFRLRFRGKRLSIRGLDIKVSYAKPSNLSETTALGIRFGATRAIYFSGIIDADSPEAYKEWDGKLRRDCEGFGPIDMIRIVPEKSIAFVYMARICDAMEAVSWLSGDPTWSSKRINFGSDRCHFERERPEIHNPLAKRTIYLGGLPKEATLGDVCGVVRGGLLDEAKMIAEKSAAFITFVRTEDANAYYTCAVSDGVVIKNLRIKASWASERRLSMQTIHALQKGATRCIHIDNVDIKALPLSTLVADLSGRFGEIESSWKKHREMSTTVFVSFCRMTSAVNAVDVLRRDPTFQGCTVGYSRDRCSIPAVSAKSLPSVPSLQLPTSYPAFPQYVHPGAFYPFPPPPPPSHYPTSPFYPYPVPSNALPPHPSPSPPPP